MAGKVYRRGVRLSKSYLTAAGCVTVERYLYEPVAAKGKSISPLELRSGIVAGYFTSRAARQDAYAMAHLTPGESEALSSKLGNMQPSRSNLDRLLREGCMLPHWEEQCVTWEAQLRTTETVPAAAQVLSVDGVMAPIRGADKREQAKLPRANTPAGRPVTRKSAVARLLCTTRQPNACKPCAMHGYQSTKKRPCNSSWQRKWPRFWR